MHSKHLINASLSQPSPIPSHLQNQTTMTLGKSCQQLKFLRLLSQKGSEVLSGVLSFSICGLSVWM
jgi:hypothetical protein